MPPAWPPPLESLASSWLPAGPGSSGVQHVPIDCPSLSNTRGSAGTCGPGCPSIVGLNSWTAGQYIQGPCSALMHFNGTLVSPESHQWLPYETRRHHPAAASVSRLANEAYATMVNVTFSTPGVVSLMLRPEMLMVTEAPWNIKWPMDAPFSYRVAEDEYGKVLLVSSVSSAAVTATALLSSAGVYPDLSVESGAGLATLAFPAIGVDRWLCVLTVVESSEDAALAAAKSFTERGAFERAWARSEQGWRDRWADAFTPKSSRYPGSLPLLTRSTADMADHLFAPASVPISAFNAARHLETKPESLPQSTSMDPPSHVRVAPSKLSPSADAGLAQASTPNATTLQSIRPLPDPLPTPRNVSAAHVDANKSSGGGDDDVYAGLSRVYYTACVTLLAMERHTYPAIAPRTYVTGFGTLDTSHFGHTIHGGAAAFYWDQALVARLHTLLDPEWMRAFVTAAFGADLASTLFIDLLTGKPTHTYGYAFSVPSLFAAAEGYVAVSGDVESFDVARMEALALEWTDPKHGAEAGGAHPFVADYGGNKWNFLECISSYVHTPAALQAQNARMMRVVARMRRSEGNVSGARVLEGLAANVSKALRKSLYIPGKGYFGVRYPDGSLVGVQTCLDFMYVADGIADDLEPFERAEMLRFFDTQLRRPHWMVALSPEDADADAAARRSDHGYTGAYNAWPALSAAAMAILQPHDEADAADAWRYVAETAAVASNGPYGQADWVRPRGQLPFKDIIPSGTRYAAINGAAFAETLIRRAFGFDLQVEAPISPQTLPKLWRAKAPRGFSAVMRNLRLPGGYLVDICADAFKGVAYC